MIHLPIRISHLRRAVVTTAALLLAPMVTFGPLFTTALACQDGGGGDTATTAPDDAMPDLSQIMKALTEIRHLEFKTPVQAEHQSLEDWEKYLDRELDKEFPVDERQDVQDGLLRLGMLLEPMDLAGEFKNALLSQAGAYYDPESGKFYYLMVDMPKEMLETVAAHELVHALQDQHFDLDKMMEELSTRGDDDDAPRNDDRVLALRFLVEGEATYVMMLWQMKTMMGMDLTENPQMEMLTLKMVADMDLDALIAMAQGQTELFGDDPDNAIAQAIRAMEDIPPYILDPLNAAYLKGAYFAMSLRHGKEGWGEIADAFKNLPASAEQTLHPAKFTTKRDDPTPIAMDQVAGFDDAGWELIDSAIHGEYYLRLLLRNFNCPGPRAKIATEGWDGDVYRAYRNDDGAVAIALATTWDSEKDAEQFFDAYTSILPTKYVELEVLTNEAQGGEFNFDCGQPSLGQGRVLLRGREVFIVEGGSAATGKSAMDSLKAMIIQHVD